MKAKRKYIPKTKPGTVEKNSRDIEMMMRLMRGDDPEKPTQNSKNSIAEEASNHGQ